MKSILDPTFRYTPSTHTDIAKTFDRIRLEQRPETRSGPSIVESGRTLTLVTRRPLRSKRQA